MESVMLIKITPENTSNPEILETGPRSNVYRKLSLYKDMYENDGVMCVSDEGWIQEYATTKQGYVFTLAIVSGIATNVSLCV